MADISVEATPRGFRIAFAGDISLRDAGRIFAEFHETLHRAEREQTIQVDTRGVTSTGLPFVQILVILDREAFSRGIRVDFMSLMSSAVKEAIIDLGCHHYFPDLACSEEEFSRLERAPLAGMSQEGGA
ncbi:hypothetical protein SAMN05920897_10569 [Alkalispirochaeta americana]|uniref:STAS domain-containing protein n=1 Tax=Alkalispirochaeta americana TaxID=159291 RepID=A0A1N6QW14_9SPIO|nr:hypothetical protein [Alkalispirochaeta americana]SIQ20702.1 hypothetical protein SAMN05920897_10569 [Alkalispirochaeta americana]